MFNFRQKLQIFLLIVFTIITYIAPSDYTKMWALIPLSLILTLVVGNELKFEFELIF